MVTPFACLLAVAFPFLAPSQAPAQPAKELAELQGTWKLMSVEVGGDVLEFTDRQARLVIQGNKVFYAGEELALLSVEGGAAPKSIDLNFLSSKRVYEGIYAVEKNTLKVCVNRQTDGVKERPDSFATKDKENWRLLVFERDQAAKPNAKEGLSGFVGMALSFDKDKQQLNIGSVLPDSAAKKADLRPKDIVLKIGGQDVTDLRGAVEACRKTMPGSKLVIRVLRDGQEMDITVTVGVVPFTGMTLLD
jgi:uncharacterized protein (TIGR03067 family)